MKTLFSRAQHACTLTALLIATGCGSSGEMPPAPAVQTRSFCPQEIHALLLADLSISMAEGGANPPTEENLRMAASLVDDCGGSLALGAIQSDGTLRLLRVTLQADTTVEPKKEHYPTTFDFIEAKLAWEKHRAARKVQIDAFIAEAVAVLAHSSDRTDLWNNLARGVTFVLEPSGADRKRVAIIITDGVSTVDSPQFDLAAVADSATWIVVHGTSDIGPLRALKPLRFENTTAAFEHLQDLIPR